MIDPLDYEDENKQILDKSAKSGLHAVITTERLLDFRRSVQCDAATEFYVYSSYKKGKEQVPREHYTRIQPSGIAFVVPKTILLIPKSLPS